MKIKNKCGNRRYFGFRNMRPGFTLEPGQTSGELPVNIAMDKICVNLSRKGEIDVILTDNDKRLLGKSAIAALKPPKKEKVKEAIPAEVKEKEEAPAAPVDPEETVNVTVEEPEVTPPVEEPEVTDCEVAPEEPEVCEDMPVADEPVEEPEGFSLPKPPSKMNKNDWLSVGMLEEIGLKNSISMSMTKTELQDAVMARLEELELI